MVDMPDWSGVPTSQLNFPFKSVTIPKTLFKIVQKSECYESYRKNRNKNSIEIADWSFC
jgi:hypothetical protein